MAKQVTNVEFLAARNIAISIINIIKTIQTIDTDP
jgi:hypothetical protein